MEWIPKIKYLRPPKLYMASWSGTVAPETTQPLVDVSGDGIVYYKQIEYLGGLWTSIEERYGGVEPFPQMDDVQEMRIRLGRPEQIAISGLPQLTKIIGDGYVYAKHRIAYVHRIDIPFRDRLETWLKNADPTLDMEVNLCIYCYGLYITSETIRFNPVKWIPSILLKRHIEKLGISVDVNLYMKDGIVLEIIGETISSYKTDIEELLKELKIWE